MPEKPAGSVNILGARLVFVTEEYASQGTVIGHIVRGRGHIVFVALDVYITRVTSNGSHHQQDSKYYAVLASFKFTIQVRGKQSHVENPAATGDFDAMA